MSEDLPLAEDTTRACPDCDRTTICPNVSGGWHCRNAECQAVFASPVVRPRRGECGQRSGLAGQLEAADSLAALREGED